MFFLKMFSGNCDYRSKPAHKGCAAWTPPNDGKIHVNMSNDLII